MKKRYKTLKIWLPETHFLKYFLSFCSIINCREICVQMTTKRWLARRQRVGVTRALRLHIRPQYGCQVNW